MSRPTLDQLKVLADATLHPRLPDVLPGEPRAEAEARAQLDALEAPVEDSTDARQLGMFGS